MAAAQHIAMLSIHSSPLARLGGKEAGGMNVYVRSLALALAQRGLHVDIFTRRQDTTSPDMLPLAPGVRVLHISAGPPAPYDKTLILEHLSELIQGIDAIAARQPAPYDLIHSHYWVSGAVALRLRDRWRVPVVQMFHTLGALKNRVARSAEETETTSRAAIERRLLHTVDVTVAATEIDRAHMVDYYDASAEGIRLVPPGVNLGTFQPQPQAAARARLNLPSTGHLLLGVGRMEPLKGFDLLIQALALLREHRGDLRLLLLGGGDEQHPADWNTEQRRLAALRDDLGLHGAVIFCGAQPHERLPDYYAAADVFVMPSLYESFGMAALEAMACGVPVVASDVGGLRTTIVDELSGLLVPPGDPRALAAALKRALLDEHQRATLRREGPRRAALYSWESIAQTIQQLYHETIEQYQAKEEQNL